MTNETKKLFSAPWKTMPEDHGIVQDVNGAAVAKCVSPAVANAFSSLPELYDKLMWAVVQKCPDAFLALDECRLCVDKKCKYREIVELLRKVRDGK